MQDLMIHLSALIFSLNHMTIQNDLYLNLAHFQTSTREKVNQDKEKKLTVQRQTEGQRLRESARRRAQFATYRPPADWLGCHHAAVAEALDVRSAWPLSHLQHGP